MKIADYYESIYGKPKRTANYKSGDIDIYIYKWDQTGEGVTIYATNGASGILGNDQTSCEFFIGIIPDADEIAEALAEVAITGNGTLDIPSKGDTLTLPFPLWDGTRMQTFLFTDGEELLASANIEGKKISFIQ
jgi:hypothetical protein